MPLRLQAVKKLATTLFQTPTPYPGTLHIAMTPWCIPLNHRGSWHAVSPEELAHAMVFAVADVVRSDAANTDKLNAWKRCLLSTTFTFKMLRTAEQRMWYALQQRENASAVHLVVHRPSFQRSHEVGRMQQRLFETLRATDVAPQQTIYEAYQKNLTMVPGAAGTVTMSFCDYAAPTWLLDVPEIRDVLLEADSLQGLSVGQCGNIFDSHSRLQHRIWVMEGLLYMMKQPDIFPKELIVADLYDLYDLSDLSPTSMS